MHLIKTKVVVFAQKARSPTKVNFLQRSFPATEFLLAIKCCEWSFSGGPAGPLEELYLSADWVLFLHVVQRHRVEALAWNCLSQLGAPLPKEVAEKLKAIASSVATHNLRTALESARLLEMFTKSEIPLIFVKGHTLGALAYPNPFLKMSSDIDILVSPGRIAEATQLLSSSGYVLRQPSPSRSIEIVAWHRFHKESAWQNPQHNFNVDLHSRLADHPSLIPSIDLHSPRQLVQILGDVTLPTLSDDELFAYLCVHGSSSAWFRLKWVTDLAALLHGRSECEIMRLYVVSQQLGAGRAAAQALLVADSIYATLGRSQLYFQLAAERTNRWLARAALKQLSRLEEPTDAWLGTATIHLTQFGLLPGATFKLSELVRQCRVTFP